MYFPEFSITTNILKFTGSIEASRAIIESTPLIPSWKKSLRKEARIKNIFHACHFEGNPLSLEGVKMHFDGKELNASPKSLREISNYNSALSYIETLPEISEETLKKLHKTLLSRIAPETATGIYRKSVSFSNTAGFISPSPDEILALVVSLLSWTHSPDARDLPTPIKAAIIFLEVLRIQPFETENKKIAGLLALLSLYTDDYDSIRLASFERLYDESPTLFTSAFRTTQNPSGDITKWIEFYLECLAAEHMRIKEKIITLAKDNKVRSVAGTSTLNERQERIVEYLHDYGGLQNKDFKRLFPDTSEDSILRDLKYLIQKNIIIKSGSTKSSRYTIKG